MRKIATNLQDCFILEPARFGDARGYYSPVYIADELAALGFQGVAQISRSQSARGILRGMHFQKDSYAQAKIVEVLRGAVVDVVIDIRPESPTYRQFTAVYLDAENNRQLYIPRGFAHGFLSLADDTLFQYYVDNAYAPDQEDGVAWDDPEIAINWPEIFAQYGIATPQLSDKDRARHTLTAYEQEHRA